MLYFGFDGEGQLVKVTSEPKRIFPGYVDFECRCDFKDLDRAEQVAKLATDLTGETYLATDSGPHPYPRYDVIRAPHVGDKISYGFNGDYYPDGVIESISKTLVVTSSNGSKYRRKKQTGSWQQPGGTWSLVQGHHNEKKPTLLKDVT